MSRALAARIVAGVLGATSAFALAYVVCVHVMAARHRMSDELRDFHEELGALTGLPAGFASRATGTLAPSSHGGVMRVSGGGKAGDELVLVAPPRRYDDGVVTFRFRIPEALGDGVEAFVGFEQSRAARSFRAAFVSGAGADEPFVHLGGDVSGPTRSGRATTEAKVQAAPGTWHILSLQFAPVFDTVAVALDGRPVSSMPVHWFQGTEASIVLGVRLRKDLPNVDVELGSVGLSTLDWQAVTSFDDHFAGEILDTKRWLFNLPDPDVGTVSSKVEPGRGLLVDARTRAVAVDPAFGFMLRTFPFPLRSMKVRVELTVDELTDATVFVGLMGASEWAPPTRVFDAGIVSRGGHPILFTAGAWKNDGSLEFVPGPPTTVPRRLAIDLAFDAVTQHGTVCLAGGPCEDRLIDLKPLDMATVRIGVLGHAPGAHALLHVTRASLSTEP
ncbi:MAG: hypothetical protein JWP97_2074 [Labilithrix sp.]|nr:hypothetical protein [Labilithrix sp.]